MSAKEYNIDGLIGPTHFYGGLAFGNLPSQAHKLKNSYPRTAAFQGLEKMQILHELGLPQAFLPPQERPCFEYLRSCGFTGNDEAILKKVSENSPDILLTAYSASSMWMANAATISPSCDTDDEKVHITPANLFSNQHRQIEVPQTQAFLKILLPEINSIVHHPPLPLDEAYADEGAANHMRISASHGLKGIELFIYGKKEGEVLSKKFPARQQFEASRLIALTHVLNKENVLLVQQHPESIDQGVFHNDLIANTNENVLLLHELAYLNTDEVIQNIKQRFEALFNRTFHCIKILKSELSLKEALQSFFFNSQIVTLESNAMCILAPIQCEKGASRKVIDRILKEDNPIEKVVFVDLTQSMNNGGGPACLRLRAVLKDREAAFIPKSLLINHNKLVDLRKWVKKHYREELAFKDLCDYKFVLEVRRALDELTGLLNLGKIYPFQKR